MASASSVCAITEAPAQPVAPVQSESSRGADGADSVCSREPRDDQAGSQPKKIKQHMNGVHLRQKAAQAVGSQGASSTLCRNTICHAEVAWTLIILSQSTAGSNACLGTVAEDQVAVPAAFVLCISHASFPSFLSPAEHWAQSAMPLWFKEESKSVRLSSPSSTEVNN